MEKRRQRQQAKGAAADVLSIMRENDIRAYAFVAIDAKGGSHHTWDTGAVMPMVAFPDVVRAIVAHSIAQSGVDDDWCPPLDRKA